MQIDHPATPGHAQRGVSMIETLIVIAILGIATSMAIPIYQIYTIRAQIAQGLALSKPVSNALTAFHHNKGAFPADNTAADLLPPGNYGSKYVESISIAGPVIEIRFGNRAHSHILGRSLTLTANSNAGSVSFRCSSGGAIQDDHLPPACR
jgi:type IV pilus assembly protein PilA